MDWQARAVAAEKALVVLKRKVRQLYNGEASSMIQRQLERARRRNELVLRRREVADVRASDLQRYSTTLEQEIKTRTQDLRNIVDNVASGFLLVDANLIVQPGHTHSCAALLGTSVIAGQSLNQLLGADPRCAAWLSLSVIQAFDDVLPEDVALAGIPSRHQLGERVLRLDPRVVRESGRVTFILITLNDVTALEEAQKQAQTHRVLMSILKQREAFGLFIDEARAQLANAQSNISDQQLVRHAVHTVKGNAAAYEVNDVVHACHDVEGHEVLCLDDLVRIEDSIRLFLAEHHAVLEIGWEEIGDRYAVSEAGVKALHDILINSGANVELDRWCNDLVMKRADAVIGPIAALVDRLSIRLEKPVAFTFVGADTLVDAWRMRSVFATLPHLLRNAVDHGIERAGERGEKRAIAVVQLQVSQQADGWCIAVTDDGRGIDAEAVVHRALAMGTIGAQQAVAMSLAAKLHLIFINGLSTSAVASDVSGRGVGMPAVLQAVENLGGHIEVTSAAGRGTTIALYVPKAGRPAQVPCHLRSCFNADAGRA